MHCFNLFDINIVRLSVKLLVVFVGKALRINIRSLLRILLMGRPKLLTISLIGRANQSLTIYAILFLITLFAFQNLLTVFDAF